MVQVACAGPAYLRRCPIEKDPSFCAVLAPSSPPQKGTAVSDAACFLPEARNLSCALRVSTCILPYLRYTNCSQYSLAITQLLVSQRLLRRAAFFHGCNCNIHSSHTPPVVADHCRRLPMTTPLLLHRPPAPPPLRKSPKTAAPERAMLSPPRPRST